MLVLSQAEWMARTSRLLTRKITSYVLLPFGLFILLSFNIMIDASGDRFHIDFREDLVNMLFITFILVVACMGIHRIYLERPLPGLYDRGIGLLGGSFVPYSAIIAIERRKMFGGLGMGTVILRTDGRYVAWHEDPVPKIPLWFLGGEGLEEALRRVRAAHAGGRDVIEPSMHLVTVDEKMDR